MKVKYLKYSPIRVGETIQMRDVEEGEFFKVRDSTQLTLYVKKRGRIWCFNKEAQFANPSGFDDGNVSTYCIIIDTPSKVPRI